MCVRIFTHLQSHTQQHILDFTKGKNPQRSEIRVEVEGLSVQSGSCILYWDCVGPNWDPSGVLLLLLLLLLTAVLTFSLV